MDTQKDELEYEEDVDDIEEDKDDIQEEIVVKESYTIKPMHPLLSQISENDLKSKLLYLKNIRRIVSENANELNDFIDSKVAQLSDTNSDNSQEDFEIYIETLNKCLELIDNNHILAAHFTGLAYKWLILWYRNSNIDGFDQDSIEKSML